MSYNNDDPDYSPLTPSRGRGRGRGRPRKNTTEPKSPQVVNNYYLQLPWGDNSLSVPLSLNSGIPSMGAQISPHLGILQMLNNMAATGAPNISHLQHMPMPNNMTATGTPSTPHLGLVPMPNNVATTGTPSSSHLGLVSIPNNMATTGTPSPLGNIQSPQQECNIAWLKEALSTTKQLQEKIEVLLSSSQDGSQNTCTSTTNIDTTLERDVAIPSQDSIERELMSILRSPVSSPKGSQNNLSIRNKSMNVTSSNYERTVPRSSQDSIERELTSILQSPVSSSHCSQIILSTRNKIINETSSNSEREGSHTKRTPLALLMNEKGKHRTESESSASSSDSLHSNVSSRKIMEKEKLQNKESSKYNFRPRRKFKKFSSSSSNSSSSSDSDFVRQTIIECENISDKNISKMDNRKIVNNSFDSVFQDEVNEDCGNALDLSLNTSQLLDDHPLDNGPLHDHPLEDIPLQTNSQTDLFDYQESQVAEINSEIPNIVVETNVSTIEGITLSENGEISIYLLENQNAVNDVEKNLQENQNLVAEMVFNYPKEKQNNLEEVNTENVTEETPLNVEKENTPKKSHQDNLEEQTQKYVKYTEVDLKKSLEVSDNNFKDSENKLENLQIECEENDLTRSSQKGSGEEVHNEFKSCQKVLEKSTDNDLEKNSESSLEENSESEEESRGKKEEHKNMLQKENQNVTNDMNLSHTQQNKILTTLNSSSEDSVNDVEEDSPIYEPITITEDENSESDIEISEKLQNTFKKQLISPNSKIMKNDQIVQNISSEESDSDSETTTKVRNNNYKIMLNNKKRKEVEKSDSNSSDSDSDSDSKMSKKKPPNLVIDFSSSDSDSKSVGKKQNGCSFKENHIGNKSKENSNSSDDSDSEEIKGGENSESKISGKLENTLQKLSPYSNSDSDSSKKVKKNDSDSSNSDSDSKMSKNIPPKLVIEFSSSDSDPKSLDNKQNGCILKENNKSDRSRKHSSLSDDSNSKEIKIVEELNNKKQIKEQKFKKELNNSKKKTDYDPEESTSTFSDSSVNEVTVEKNENCKKNNSEISFNSENDASSLTSDSDFNILDISASQKLINKEDSKQAVDESENSENERLELLNMINNQYIVRKRISSNSSDSDMSVEIVGKKINTLISKVENKQAGMASSSLDDSETKEDIKNFKSYCKAVKSEAKELSPKKFMKCLSPLNNNTSSSEESEFEEEVKNIKIKCEVLGSPKMKTLKISPEKLLKSNLESQDNTQKLKIARNNIVFKERISKTKEVNMINSDSESSKAQFSNIKRHKEAENLKICKNIKRKRKSSSSEDVEVEDTPINANSITKIFTNNKKDEPQKCKKINKIDKEENSKIKEKIKRRNKKTGQERPQKTLKTENSLNVENRKSLGKSKKSDNRKRKKKLSQQLDNSVTATNFKVINLSQRKPDKLNYKEMMLYGENRRDRNSYSEYQRTQEKQRIWKKDKK